MTKLVKPIASPLINGTLVRFFKAPLPELHIPWHSVDDLHRALHLPRHLSKQLLENSRAFPRGEFQTIATADGPVVIGSHPMAQGMLGAAIEAGGAPERLGTAYAMAAAEAMKALVGDVPVEARIAMSLTAARNTLGLGK